MYIVVTLSVGIITAGIYLESIDVYHSTHTIEFVYS